MRRAFKFWKWVRAYSLERMKANTNCWTKCWKCNNFDFEKPWRTWITTEHPMIDEAECGNCGHVSRWRMDGMGPIPIDGPNGQPF